MNKYFIGITGHRTFQEQSWGRVSRELEKFFIEIRQLHQDKELFLRSPLAEGADRLAASIALQHGIKLIVPMPFPKSEYMKDFETEESLEEFEDLCYRAIEVFPVKTELGVDRTENYLSVGSYVAQTSHILLALWDCAKKLEKTGGTAQIVRYQFEGFPEPYECPPAFIPNRETYIIYTPRATEDRKVEAGFYSYREYQSL